MDLEKIFHLNTAQITVEAGGPIVEPSPSASVRMR